MSTLFDELKRRNVFRAAVAYIVTAWLILQVADVILGNIEAPDWVFSVFLLAVALLFIPVIIFSWAYEITPEGIKREADVDRSTSITPQTGKKLNLITIIMLVVVVAFVFVERQFFHASDGAHSLAVELQSDDAAPAPAADEEPSDEVTATVVDDNSIAVLAFEDLSPAGDQAFFAEGLSEELLNVLAQVPELKVAGRTSSFAFKGKDADLREIGDVLNVAHILEGSVRKAGNRIRVTAQLIKASDGFHVFSETYDRNLDDVFAVQDELAELIGDALLAELGGGPDVPSVTPTSLETYDLYLLARQRIRTREPAQMQEAARMLDEALAIDADYAPAIAQRALVEYLLSDAPGAYGEIPEREATAKALALLDRALELDPELAEGYAVLGLIKYPDAETKDEAIGYLRRALDINPNSTSAKVWLANALPRGDEVNALYEEVVVRDPMFGPAFSNLINMYVGTADIDKADALISRVERITGETVDVHYAKGVVAFLDGRLADAARNLQVPYDANPNQTIMLGWRAYTLIQLGDLEAAVANDHAPTKIVALRELGELDRAESVIAAMDFSIGDRQRKLRHAADFYGAIGQPEKLIQIVDEQYGGVDAILEELPLEESWGAEYQGSLAYVYLQAGRVEEFEKVVAALRGTLDRAKELGFDNWYHWYSEAQYAALTGDADAANTAFQRALNEGLASVLFYEPTFSLLDDNPRFRELRATMVAKANAERAKLGLERYQPINPTD